MCEELKLVQLIDTELDNEHFNQTITTGQATVGIILNLLNILQKPLMLSHEFMQIRPINRLIGRSPFDAHQRNKDNGEKIKSEDFNQHKLGRTLDLLYDYGLEELFMTISSVAFGQFQRFQSRFLHTDTTSMSVYRQSDSGESDRPGVIQLKRGHSKEKRPDLRQFIIGMITCKRLPVFIETASGNTSDKTYFRELITEYGDQLTSQFEREKIFVFDSAFYNEPNLISTHDSIKYITRVPLTIKKAIKYLEETDQSEFESCNSEKLDDYEITGKSVSYKGFEHRWILVYSKSKYKRDRNNFLEDIAEIEADMEKKQSDKNQLLRKDDFTTKEEARKAVKAWEEEQQYHSIKDITFTEMVRRADGKRGRIGKDTPTKIEYGVKFTIIRDEEAIDQQLSTAGRFILATNESTENLSGEETLLGYKSQQYVERGFRFLKDPFFFADSIFLEKPERISALSMIMGLSLLVYNLCELKLREALQKSGEKFHNNTLKPTGNPTIRRVFETFEGIQVHYLRTGDSMIREKVLNKREWHHQVLGLMGDEYKQRYEDGRNQIGQLSDLFQLHLNEVEHNQNNEIKKRNNIRRDIDQIEENYSLESEKKDPG